MGIRETASQGNWRPRDAYKSGLLSHLRRWTVARRLSGWGLVFKEYGSGRQADAEYLARVRRIFDDAGVHWQTHAYRAGYGGATIAQWFANANIDAIDVGIGVLSMHSPLDISAKADVWELYRGFKAFFGASASLQSPSAR